MLRALKNVIAGLLTSVPVGKTLAALTGNRFRSRGLWVDTSHPGITPPIKAALFWNAYESAEVRFVHRYLRTDFPVVELGASLGVMACQIRQRIPREQKLVCVEASPALKPVIERNLALNGMEANTAVVSAAIDYSGAATVTFSAGPDTLGGRKADSGIAVPAMTLSALLAQHHIADYALVCDIEGAEAGFIFHDAAALQRCRQLIIELHDPEVDGRRWTANELRDRLLHDHGFRLVDQRSVVCVLEK